MSDCPHAGQAIRDGTRCIGMYSRDDGAAECRHRDRPSCPEVDADVARVVYLASVGFGRRYRDPREEVLFGNAPERQAVAVMARAYWATIGERIAAGEGMMLTGAVGTGKTFALALTALAAWPYSHEARYIYAPTLFTMLHRQDLELPEYQGAPLLLIDDFGTAHSTDWTVAGFDAFVEYRHSESLATCITSNWSVARLREQTVFERVIDRWRESCAGRIGELVGESMRGGPE